MCRPPRLAQVPMTAALHRRANGKPRTHPGQGPHPNAPEVFPSAVPLSTPTSSQHLHPEAQVTITKFRADPVIFVHNISSLIQSLPKYPAGAPRGLAAAPRPAPSSQPSFGSSKRPMLPPPPAATPQLRPTPPPSLSLNITSSGDPLTLGTRSRSRPMPSWLSVDC